MKKIDEKVFGIIFLLTFFLYKKIDLIARKILMLYLFFPLVFPISEGQLLDFSFDSYYNGTII